MITEWMIKYWHTGPDPEKSEIEEWFNELPQEQAQSVAKEVALLEKCGNTLTLPHSKSLKKKLFELRERRFGERIYYTFYQPSVIVVLAAGNKSTQKHDIKKAHERLHALMLSGEHVL